MSERDIRILNQLLDGCYIAINSCTDALNRVDDVHARQRLEDFKKSQFEMAEELASFIRDTGGDAHRDPGLRGSLAMALQAARLSGRGGCKEDLQSLHRGTEMGIAKYKSALGKVNGQPREIIERHIARNQGNLEVLEDAYRGLH